MIETLLVLLLVGAPAPAQGEPAGELVWSPRTAEHLWNRAGFGAGSQEVARAVALGPEAFVAELFAGEPYVEEPFYARPQSRRDMRRMFAGMEREDRREAVAERRDADRAQLRDYLAWWVERMIAGNDPLRERMTLFWHGHFTSSMSDVKNSHEMIRQNQLLRTHALGSFRRLLYAVARDPAMLEYLDNASNRAGNPNENFARELMELFTLGEGHYTEADVKEVARAFTGWTDSSGRFRFRRGEHDYGEKTVLGVTGRLNGDDVLEILLEQEACPRFVAGELLTYLEGVEPDEERLARYARVLREADYEVAALLEELFLDPAFYRDQALGTRITSPLDYLVGCARRIGCDPPPHIVLVGAAAMGQRLFFPPNVKGWEEGEAWLTTSALLQRANLAGVLLGRVTLEDFLRYDPLADPTMDPFLPEAEAAASDMEDAPLDELLETARLDDEPDARRAARRRLGELRGLRTVDRLGWHPRLNLTTRLRRLEVVGDAAVVDVLCDELLAVEAGAATRAELTAWLAEECAAAGLHERELLDDSQQAEPLLRQLAHVILGLPEAQLH